MIIIPISPRKRSSSEEDDGPIESFIWRLKFTFWALLVLDIFLMGDRFFHWFIK